MKKFTVLLITLLCWHMSFTQVPRPDWFFTNTGCNHTILFPDSANVSLNGDTILYGDFIGVFFDSLGYQACASGIGNSGPGGLMWNDSSLAIPVWMDDATTVAPDGMMTGEVFKFKWWRAIDSSVVDFHLQFDPAFPNDSTACCNGFSHVISFSFAQSNNIGIPSSKVIFLPCELSDAVEITVPLKNYDDKPALNFPVRYSIDGGNSWVTEIYKPTLLPNSSHDYTFTQTADMSAQHPYEFIAFVDQPGDIDHTNDTFSIFVPVITLDTAYFASTDITLDAGAGFSSYLWSDGSTNQTIIASHEDWYSVTVTFNNCTTTGSTYVSFEGITENTTPLFRVYPNPANKTINIEQEGTTIHTVSAVEIYDLAGALLYKENFGIGKQELRVSVSQFKPGRYILKVNGKYRCYFEVMR